MFVRQGTSWKGDNW